VGALTGIINEKITLELDVKIKCDYLYCIKSYLNNGGLIRFSNVAMKYDIAKNTGSRTEQMIKESKLLIERYPELVKRNPRRKQDGEVLLINKTQRV
jgi:hypothetical protein